MKKISLSIILMLCCVVSSYALNIPEPMRPARMVNDFAAIFNQNQIAALEAKLVDFDRTTSTQIAVVTVNDLDGTTASDYASQLFDKWGIGGSKNNNGILILLKPKSAASKGEVFIATGYGIEGVVPDALAGRIVDYDMTPAFQKGDYYAGVSNAANTLMSLTKGEYTAEEYLKKRENGPSGLIFVIVWVAIIFLSSLSRRRGASHTYSSSGDDIARGIILGSMLSRGSRGGGFSSFSGGGGGFGGFGGGFSGGGGAGGSW